MIVEQVKRDIQRSDAFQERSMGLAVGSEAFVFNVLRKDLYSDPIGSLIREYTVNAQDEHRKHGKTTTPIFIKVPNQFEPELHIRDYAGGLTEEQVFEFFGKYGASDKRDSNVAVGFFGLGCKSAFAYTDSYIVKSFKDGTAYTFNIYIDETEIGRVAKLSEEPTFESNGVLVIVPVKTKDVSDFQEKVIKTVSHFKVKPILEGFATQPEFIETTPIIEGNGWKFYGIGSPRIIMGEIAYPFTASSFPVDLESWERELLNSNLEITSTIGEVQVTASREALQMSPKTINAIRARLATIKAEMLAETKKAFDSAKNIFEAKSLYYSAVLSGSGYGKIVRQSGSIEWNGVKLADNVIRFGELSGHSVSTYKQNWKGQITPTTGHNLICSKELNIFFDDTNGVKVNYKRRAVTLLNAGAKEVTILHTSNKKDLEKILGMKVSALPSLNKVEPTMPQTVGRIGTGIDKSKRAKHTAKVFALKSDEVRRFYRGIASNIWEIKEIDTRNAVYIPIDRFHPTLPQITSLYQLGEVFNSLDKLGIDSDVTFVGIKAGQETGKMVRFDKWLQGKLDALDDLKYELTLGDAYNNMLLDVKSFNENEIPDGLAKEYHKLYMQAREFNTSKRRSDVTLVFKRSGLEVVKNETLAKLDQEVDIKYPIIKLIGTWERGKGRVMDYIRERQATVSQVMTASA